MAHNAGRIALTFLLLALGCDAEPDRSIEDLRESGQFCLDFPETVQACTVANGPPESAADCLWEDDGGPIASADIHRATAWRVVRGCIERTCSGDGSCIHDELSALSYLNGADDPTCFREYALCRSLADL